VPNVEITADVFIGSVIAIMVAYGFIIGRNGILRIILSTYLAILAADGVSLFIEGRILSLSPILNKIFNLFGAEGIVSLKIFIFIAIIVILVVRGAFTIDLPLEKFLSLRIISTGFVSLLSANLIISAILVYIAGGSFLQSNLNNDLSLLSLYQESILAKTLIENFHLSFLLPVITFIVFSLIYNEE